MRKILFSVDELGKTDITHDDRIKKLYQKKQDLEAVLKRLFSLDKVNELYYKGRLLLCDEEHPFNNEDLRCYNLQRQNIQEADIEIKTSVNNVKAQFVLCLLNKNGTKNVFKGCEDGDHLLLCYKDHAKDSYPEFAFLLRQKGQAYHIPGESINDFDWEYIQLAADNSYHAKDGCFKNLTLHSREEGARIVNLPDTLCVQKRDKSGTDISADIYLTEQGLNRKGLFTRETTVEDDYVISKLNEATSRFLLDENVIPLSFRYFKKKPKKNQERHTDGCHTDSSHTDGVALNERFQPSYDLLQSEKQYASVFAPFLADGPERKKEDTDHTYLSEWKKYLAAREAGKGIYILPVKEKNQPTTFNILYVDADRYNTISEKNLLLKLRFSYAAEENAKIKNIIFKGAWINPLGDSYDDSRQLTLPYAESDGTKLHILSRSARESVSADRSHINSETVDSIQQELWKITDALVKYLAAPKEDQSPYERLTAEECLCLLPYFYRSLWETENSTDQEHLKGVIREVYEKAALCEKVPFNGIEALTDDLCHGNPSLQTVHLDGLSVFGDPLSQFYPMKTPFGYSYHYYLGSDMNFIGSLPKTSYHTENGGRCYFFPSDIWEAMSAPLRISCMTAVSTGTDEMFYIRYTPDDSGYIYADTACRRVFFKNWLQWYRTGTEQSVYRDLYIPAFEEYKAIALRKEVLFLASEKWGLCDAFIRVPQCLFEEEKEKSEKAISEDEMTYLTGLAEKYSYDPPHFNRKEAQDAYIRLFEEMKSCGIVLIPDQNS